MALNLIVVLFAIIISLHPSTAIDYTQANDLEDYISIVKHRLINPQLAKKYLQSNNVSSNELTAKRPSRLQCVVDLLGFGEGVLAGKPWAFKGKLR
jgi:hypothetical protein